MLQQRSNIPNESSAMTRFIKPRARVLAILCAIALFSSVLLAGCDHEAATIESDSPVKIAFLASTGGVNDGTLCEADYKMLKEYCSERGIPFRYYQHAKENTVESEVVIDAAVADGYNVLIACDYTYALALAAAQTVYPEITFISLDTTESDFGEAGLASNTVAVSFEEEVAGYFAGYAAVALGHRHIGFLGGMAVPAVIKFNNGYVRGANQAAIDYNVGDAVCVETVMGNQFYGDSDITAYMDTWFQSLGVTCVFSCGGGIYTSNAEAAQKVGGKTIGVDSDQKAAFDEYAKDMCITSALKNTPAALRMLLDEIRAGNFSAYGGRSLRLGLASPTDPDLNYVGIPLETTQWNSSFTQEDYLNLVARIYNRTLSVSGETPAADELVITVNDRGSVK